MVVGVFGVWDYNDDKEWYSSFCCYRLFWRVLVVFNYRSEWNYVLKICGKRVFMLGGRG